MPLRNYLFDELLRSSPEVLAGAPHVFTKVFAASDDAAMLNVVAHAFAGFANLAATLLHLPARRVAVLSKACQWDQGERNG